MHMLYQVEVRHRGGGLRRGTAKSIVEKSTRETEGDAEKIELEESDREADTIKNRLPMPGLSLTQHHDLYLQGGLRRGRLMPAAAISAMGDRCRNARVSQGHKSDSTAKEGKILLERSPSATAAQPQHAPTYMHLTCKMI